jgi:hypothetical protein
MVRRGNADADIGARLGLGGLSLGRAHGSGTAISATMSFFIHIPFCMI